jgi:hypothetical protein
MRRGLRSGWLGMGMRRGCGVEECGIGLLNKDVRRCWCMCRWHGRGVIDFVWVNSVDAN